VRNLNERLADLGLTTDPFASDTPLESLFPGAMRRASLDQMQLLARESEDIVALTGPAGSGKTTLGDFFARHADRDQVVARIRATLLTTPSQLLEDMFKAFVLDFPEQATLADLKAALQRYFAALHRQSRTVVLIVDSAHELGDDALSLLTKLALNDNHDATFHLLLLGEPSLLDMLDYTCPMREGQPQFTAVQLPAFSLEETRAYLRYRLSGAGYNQDDAARTLPYSNRQVERIHKLSGGIPAAINARASDLLGDGGLDLLDLLPSLPAELPRPYVYATAGALAVIVLVALLLGGNEDPELAQSNLSEPVPIPLEPVNTIRTVDDALDVDTDPAIGDNVATGLATGIPLTTPLDTSDAPASQTNADTANAEPAAAAANLTSATPEASATPSVAPARAVATAPAATAASPVSSASTPAPATTPARAVAATTPAPASTPARPAAAASTSDATAPLASQHTRIRALPANQFTVQLLGSTSRANVEDFVRRHASTPLYWFETRNQGNPWFVIMMGAYPSRAAAQTAASGLSGELGRLEPWIRSIGTIHGEIVAGN
jgi:DamX protein